jgi:hypothetical protein
LAKKRTLQNPRGTKLGTSEVGRGYGRRKVVRVPLPELLTEKKYSGFGFDRLSHAAETWAKETLECAGFPANGDQLPAVEARGFREFECDEWRAAAILYCLSWIRHYEKEAARGELTPDDFKKTMSYAARVGGLFREVRIQELARKDANQARPVKPNPVILRYVKSRLRANGNLTTGALWKELEQYDPINQYRRGRDNLFVDRGKLHARIKDKKHIIARSSFRRYVTIARSELSRPRTRMK